MNKNTLVRKSNCLNRASYSLSPLEHKIVNFLATQIRPTDKEFQFIKIRVRDFFKMVDITTNDFSILLDHLNNIRRQDMTLTYEDEYGRMLTLRTSWFSGYEYVHGSGEVMLSIDPILSKMFLQLRSFYLAYDFGYITKMKSRYSIRLYEILKEMLYRTTIRVFKYERLRWLLGIEKDGYVNYFNFRRVILEKARKEINSHTDISIEIEEIKSKRVVVEIKFIIKEKKTDAQLNRKLAEDNLATDNPDVLRLDPDSADEMNAE